MNITLHFQYNHHLLQVFGHKYKCVHFKHIVYILEPLRLCKVQFMDNDRVLVEHSQDIEDASSERDNTIFLFITLA